MGWLDDAEDRAKLAAEGPWDYLWCENRAGAGQNVQSMGMREGFGLFRHGAQMWPANEPHAVGVSGPTSFTTDDAAFIASVREDAPRAYALVRQLGEALRVQLYPDNREEVLAGVRIIDAALAAYRAALADGDGGGGS